MVSVSVNVWLGRTSIKPYMALHVPQGIEHFDGLLPKVVHWIAKDLLRIGEAANEHTRFFEFRERFGTSGSRLPFWLTSGSKSKPSQRKVLR